jgi:hypothetical protein
MKATRVVNATARSIKKERKQGSEIQRQDRDIESQEERGE